MSTWETVFLYVSLFAGGFGFSVWHAAHRRCWWCGGHGRERTKGGKP